MDLEGAAPLRLPALVEINDEVQAPVQLLRFVIVEIHVRVQFLAMLVLVRAAAVHLRIDDEVRNSG